MSITNNGRPKGAAYPRIESLSIFAIFYELLLMCLDLNGDLIRTDTYFEIRCARRE